VPVIAALEQRILSLLKRRADELMERRRQDVRDQAEELAPSMTTSQYLGPWAGLVTWLSDSARGLVVVSCGQTTCFVILIAHSRKHSKLHLAIQHYPLT
jgi:hypothetical protein